MRPDRERELPLSISYELSAPLVWTGHPIHFDALLALVAGRGRSDMRIGWEPGDECLPRLPLAIQRHADEWWYRASAWSPPSLAATTLVRYARKWDHEDEDLLDCRAARTVTLTNARYKEAWLPLEIVHVRSVVFFAVGDYVHVRHLARRVRQIGKKGSQGYGEVAQCRVERLGRDSAEFDRDWRVGDKPARNLPVAFCRDRGLVVDERVAPLRPPYWRRRAEHVTVVG